MRYSRLSCVGSITSSHILSSKKVHIPRRVGFNHVRDSIWLAPKPIFLQGGRMAEWFRPADCEILTIKLRGINYQFAHLVFKKSSYRTSRWFQSRPQFYMAPASADFCWGRMADWLRPADCEVLTIKLRGINYQFAHLVSEKSPYGTSRWFQSRPRFYMAPASADI